MYQRVMVRRKRLKSRVEGVVRQLSSSLITKQDTLLFLDATSQGIENSDCKKRHVSSMSLLCSEALGGKCECDPWMHDVGGASVGSRSGHLPLEPQFSARQQRRQLSARCRASHLRPTKMDCSSNDVLNIVRPPACWLRHADHIGTLGGHGRGKCLAGEADYSMPPAPQQRGAPFDPPIEAEGDRNFTEAKSARSVFKRKGC